MQPEAAVAVEALMSTETDARPGHRPHRASTPWLKLGWRVLGAGVVFAAVFVLWRQLRSVTPAELVLSMKGWGPWRIGAAVLMSSLSFALVALFEWLGLRRSGAPTSRRPASPRD
jgi:uncharacterized membrane protein YbhN (UPF0104 family)